MKSSEVLLFGALALIGVNIFQKLRAASTLRFMPGNISGIGFEGSMPYFDFTVRVQNTSSSGFTIQSLAADLVADGTYIGNISSFVPTHINANSETFIPIRARLQLIGVVTQIMEAFNGAGFHKEITVQGWANVGLFKAPLNMKFSIGSGG